jgi:hypothetical protein
MSDSKNSFGFEISMSSLSKIFPLDVIDFDKGGGVRTVLKTT